MKIKFKPENTNKARNIRFIVYFVSAIVLSVANLTVINYISVEGLMPDLTLILCVLIAVREGQFIGVFAGFFIGLIFDFLSPEAVIGTGALTKTVVGLIAGWFHREKKTDFIIGSYRFLLIVLFSSIVHNAIYFFMYVKSSELMFMPFFLKYGIAISLYTTVFAVFPMMLKMPKKGYL